MERRHALKRIIATVLAVVVVWHEELFDYFYPAAPARTLHHYTLNAEPMALTLTGGDVEMRVGGSTSV